ATQHGLARLRLQIIRRHRAGASGPAASLVNLEWLIQIDRSSISYMINDRRPGKLPATLCPCLPRAEATGRLTNGSKLPEELEMQIPMKPVTKDQMLKRVARYKALKFPADRYPDSQLPGHVRKNILIVGTGLVVDGGKDPMSAIPINEGFTMSYVLAKP